MVRTCPSIPVTRPMVFPTRESPLLKVKRSVNCPVVLLYPTPFEPERDESEIFELRDHESTLRAQERLYTVPESARTSTVRFVKFVVRVFTDQERFESPPKSERISPVAVARKLFVVEIVFVSEKIFPVAVARYPLVVARLALVVARPLMREEIRLSCAVLVPWSFWNASRIESAEVTVPEPATNPERSEVRLSFPEKVL